jgi:lipopolysaccharide export LptBFGC system permease protein LptF
MNAAMPTLNRYLAREVFGAVSLILLGFLGLFAFFDLLGEFRHVGTRPAATIREAVTRHCFLIRFC